MGEEPERAAAFGADEAEEFGALFVILPGAVGFEAEEFANAESGFAAAEVFVHDVVALEIFLRDVDAAERVVVVDVANDVGELEGEAEFFGEVESALIGEAEDVRAGEADGAGDAVAIFAEAVEGGVIANGEIHLGAGDEVVEIARGHVVAAHGVHESGENFGGALGSCGGRQRRAGDGGVERGAPAGEAFLFDGDVFAFVGDVVDEAHEGVEGDDAVAAGFREEEEGVIEIAVGGFGDLQAGLVGRGDR